ncbi:MAG: YjjG family noncanonical pyrimidine nucleotidase [Eubacteriales bacterium]|nr:YjjG family noncanonical pyrimidine nucleotidase [Eubacteriales bacterium]
MIKHVFLDLDNTILDFNKAERGALSRTLAFLGLEPTEDVLARYHIINQNQWERLERGEASREEILLKRFQILFDEYGIQVNAMDAKKIYERELAIGHFFLPGAEKLLEDLGKDYDLYLASNGTKIVQDGRIESAGIAGCFREIFISEELGYNKPSVEYFEKCFEKIPGLKKEECVIIGDSLSSDILGGLQAGIHTLWYNPDKKEAGEKIQPEIQVQSLSEIPEALKNLNRIK